MATNYEEFLKKFKENQQLVLNACKKTIDATVLDMYKKIIDRTPVGNPALWHPPYWPKGYTPGQLKSSWQISFNGIQRATTGRFASSSQTLAGGGVSLKVDSGNKNVVVISNPQPYAARIEYGSWSSQAPAGMMRITVAEFVSINDHNAAQYRIS